MKRPIKTTLILFSVFALVLAFVEFGGITRADGGGKQIVTIAIQNGVDIDRIRFAPTRDPDGLATAFATSDQLLIYESLLDAAQLRTLSDLKWLKNVAIDQQWSFTEMGLTKRRPEYGQTFSHVVFDVRYSVGGSKQFVIELPPYCRETALEIDF